MPLFYLFLLNPLPLLFIPSTTQPQACADKSPSRYILPRNKWLQRELFLAEQSHQWPAPPPLATMLLRPLHDGLLSPFLLVATGRWCAFFLPTDKDTTPLPLDIDGTMKNSTREEFNNAGIQTDVLMRHWE